VGKQRALDKKEGKSATGLGPGRKGKSSFRRGEKSGETQRKTTQSKIRKKREEKTSLLHITRRNSLLIEAQGKEKTKRKKENCTVIILVRDEKGLTRGNVAIGRKRKRGRTTGKSKTTRQKSTRKKGTAHSSRAGFGKEENGRVALGNQKNVDKKSYGKKA